MKAARRLSCSGPLHGDARRSRHRRVHLAVRHRHRDRHGSPRIARTSLLFDRAREATVSAGGILAPEPALSARERFISIRSFHRRAGPGPSTPPETARGLEDARRALQFQHPTRRGSLTCRSSIALAEREIDDDAARGCSSRSLRASSESMRPCTRPTSARRTK